MKQFYKVLLGTESSACPGFHYNIDAVTEANHWDPAGKNPADMGGFSIATAAAIIRWICRGNILYDVIIPEDAEIVYPEHPSKSVYGELARVNKVVLTNPRPMSDEIAMEFYRKSKFKHDEYYKILAICAVCGHEKTCEAILHERIGPENAKKCVHVWENFLTPEHCSYPYNPNLYYQVLKKLCTWAKIDVNNFRPMDV